MNSKWSMDDALLVVFAAVAFVAVVGLLALAFVSQHHEAACIEAAIEGKYEASEILLVCSRR